MRERLTACFVAITLLLLVGAGIARSYAIEGQLRAHEGRDVTTLATAIGQVLADVVAQGLPVDDEALAPFVGPGVRLVYAEAGRPDVVLTGDGFVDDDEAPSATVVTGEGAVTVTQSHDDDLHAAWGGDWLSTLALFGLLALVAGLIGYLVARALSAPFRQLAVAAAALGRGRFDLDLPRGGVPEARAIAQALESSAGQLRDRLEREREFGLHASHVLRTPLTSLRLRLEELVDDPGMSAEARDAVQGSLKAVGRLTEAAGELVELSGRGVLVAGAAIPLRDLATQVAQRWADVLDGEGRQLTAAVEGDIELPFTPGPIEQVLDLLLEDVVTLEAGSVRLVFEGAASRLRVDVLCTRPDGRTAPPTEAAEDRVETVVAALGGRIEHADGDGALRLHLPRR